MARKRGQVKRIIDWGIKGIGQVNFHGLYDNKRDYHGYQVIAPHKRRVWKGKRRIKIDVNIGFKEVALTIGTAFALGLMYNKFIKSAPSAGQAAQRIQAIEKKVGKIAKNHDAFAHTVSSHAKDISLRVDQVEKVVSPMLNTKSGIEYLKRVHNLVVVRKTK